MTISIAVLDDYQGVAEQMADWNAIPDSAVTFLGEPLQTANATIGRLAEFDVIVAMRERTQFPEAVLAALPRLRLLVSTGAWNAAIDVTAANRLGIVVCATGVVPSAAPELTWALILALVKNVVTEDTNMRVGRWQTTVGGDLAGATIGLIGLGHVGSQVAKVAIAFGMTVVAWSHNLTADRAAENGATRVELGELLAISDIVSVHTRLTDLTRGLIGAAELAAMKPGALLINTSRGPIVDEAALVDAVRDGHLGGVALDVYADEPLPADSPLRTLPDSVLTPHMGFVSERTYRRFYGDAVDDIVQFLAGTPVRVMSPPP